MWFEKYRPHSIEDIAISEHKIAALRRWFKEFHEGTQTGCALLFTGPPGLGKTTMAHVILREHGYKVKEFNASDTRSKTLIGECLDSLINYSDVTKVINRDEPPVGIIMDEVDGMFKGDRGGIQELLSYISQPSKRSKKENKNVGGIVPVICICNLGHVKKDTIKHLQKVCYEVSFTLPERSELLHVLQRVVLGEGLTIDAEATEQIIEHCQKDFRRLVTFMEFLYISYGSTITVEQVAEGADNFSSKERDLHITDSIKKILNRQLPADEISNIYNGDKSKAPMVIHQNYLKAICLQETTVQEKLTCAIATMDSIVTSDVIEKIMYNTQCWFLQPIQGYASSYITNYYINKHPKSMVVQSVWASVLSVSSQSQNLKKNAHELQYNMHSYTIDDIQSLIEIVFQLLITGKYEHAVKYIVQYKLCVLDEFKTKKAITVIDKIAKFIKLSRYYTRWADFKEIIKNDKAFDKKIQDLVLLHDDGPRMTKVKPGTQVKKADTKADTKSDAKIQKPVVKPALTLKGEKPKVQVVPKKPTLVPIAPTAPLIGTLGARVTQVTQGKQESHEELVKIRKTVVIKKKL